MISGSFPKRPTIVIRASCEARVVENLRADDEEREDALRRIGEKRKDIAAGPVLAGGM